MNESNSPIWQQTTKWYKDSEGNRYTPDGKLITGIEIGSFPQAVVTPMSSDTSKYQEMAKDIREQMQRQKQYQDTKDYYDNRSWYNPSKVIDNMEDLPVLGLVPWATNSIMEGYNTLLGNKGTADYFNERANAVAKKQLLPVGITAAQFTPAAPYIDTALSSYLLTNSADKANLRQGWDLDSGMQAALSIAPTVYKPFKTIKETKANVKDYINSTPYRQEVISYNPNITQQELDATIAQRQQGVDNALVLPIPTKSIYKKLNAGYNLNNFWNPEKNNSYVVVDPFFNKQSNFKENLTHELLHASHGIDMRNLTQAEQEALRTNAGTLVAPQYLKQEPSKNISNYILYLNDPEEQYAWRQTGNMLGPNSYNSYITNKYLGQ